LHGAKFVISIHISLFTFNTAYNFLFNTKA
jgi:hypothetical protein